MKKLVNGINLGYNEIGSGRPCIMLHGNRDRKEVFEGLSHVVSQKCNMHVFSIDLRGHGESDKPDGGYTINHFVEDIISFIQEENLKEVTLVGHSLGSTISMSLVNKFPELVDKLVLMGAAAEFKIGFKRPEFTRENFKDMIEETNKRIAPLFFREDRKNIKDIIVHNWANVDFNVHMNLIKLQHPDLKEVAANIKNDTLLICGEKDLITTVEKGKQLNKLIKKSELSIIPEAGHFMFLEESEVVSECIIKFLNKKLAD